MTQSPRQPPVLPLVRDPALEALDKTNSKAFDLRVDPNQNGPTHRVHARALKGDEAPRQVLQWHRTTNEVIRGLSIDAWEPAQKLVLSLIDGVHRDTFNNGLTTLATMRMDERRQAALRAVGRTDAERRQAAADIDAAGVNDDANREFDHIEEALRFVILDGIPKSALQKVKRFLRRDCRKPSDMTIREYYQHLTYINREEIPLLPTSRPNPEHNRFADDELIDIILCATPKSWQREMEKQGFDPIEKTSSEVVTFMERIEASEDIAVPAKAKNNSNGSKKSKTSSSKHGGGKKICLIHGEGNHTSDECRTLQAKAKEAKGSWERKAKSAKNSKEVAAFIKKSVAKGVKEQLKKREREANNVETTNDDLADIDFENLDVDDISV